MSALDSVFVHRLKKFKSFKRGYYSFLIILFLILSSFFLEFISNNKALLVKYRGQYYFPVFGQYYSDEFFGGQEDISPNYRDLKKRLALEPDSWVLLTIIPYGPYEADFSDLSNPPPYPPSLESRHFLGTDTAGRDVLSRLLYGFRTTIFFAIALYIINTIIGVTIGCFMGYYGGWFDLIMQRLVEIWSNLPVLYLIIIIGSFVQPNIYFLLAIFAILNWTGISWLMRAEILREKRLQYSKAALSIGASSFRVIFYHLLPNSIVPVLASFPFQVIGAISALTSLDYLGYGLQVPTPSWGELIQQGQQTFDFAPWIVLAPCAALVITLLIFAFIGEALRDTLDPKSNSFYY